MPVSATKSLICKVIFSKEWDVKGVVDSEFYSKHPEELPHVSEEFMYSKVTVVIKGIVKYVTTQSTLTWKI